MVRKTKSTFSYRDLGEKEKRDDANIRKGGEKTKKK